MASINDPVKKAFTDTSGFLPPRLTPRASRAAQGIKGSIISTQPLLAIICEASVISSQLGRAMPAEAVVTLGFGDLVGAKTE
jgi:hypothetical protein